MQGSAVLALVLLALCLICLSPPLQAADGQPVERFEASYRVERGGISVGEARLQLEYSDKDRYRMQSSLRLTGLVSLLAADRVDEEVHGELSGGMPRPLTYRSRRDGKKAGTVSLQFDWTRGEVAATKNGKAMMLTLQPLFVDPVSLHLLVILDLQAGRKTGEYSVVSGNRLKTYRTRLLGKASIKTALGEFETLMVSRQRQGSDNVTTYWHAPELGYLPVQISKADAGGEVARLTIATLKR